MLKITSITPLCANASLKQQVHNMSTIDIGPTPRSTIIKARDSRTFGHEDFNFGRGGKMAGEATRKRVEKQRRGRTLGHLAGIPASLVGNDMLDLFRTKHVTPLYNDGLGDESGTNVNLVVNRRVKAVASCFGSVEHHQLCILYKKNDDMLNAGQMDGCAFSIQMNPLDIISPQVFNFAIFQLQEREAEQFPEIYAKRTPQDYWKDYCIDGIAEHVTAIENRASIYEPTGSRYEGTALTNPTACASLVTMITKGVHKITNYWGSNVKPGAHLYILIKKFLSEDYNHDYRQGKLTLSNSTAKKLGLKPANDSLKNPLTPYQMTFLSLPHGGLIPVEELRYIDEAGNLRTDTLVIRIGTVTEVPLGHVFRENGDRLRPFNGILPQCSLSSYSTISDSLVNFATYNNQKITIIFNPDDGIRTI